MLARLHGCWHGQDAPRLGRDTAEFPPGRTGGGPHADRRQTSYFVLVVGLTCIALSPHCMGVVLQLHPTNTHTPPLCLALHPFHPLWLISVLLFFGSFFFLCLDFYDKHYSKSKPKPKSVFNPNPTPHKCHQPPATGCVALLLLAIHLLCAQQTNWEQQQNG